MFKKMIKNLKTSGSEESAFLRHKKELNASSNFYFYSSAMPVWSSTNYEELARRGYMQNVIAYRAISMIAEAAASIPIKLYGFKAGGEKCQILDHQILDTLNSPNPIQSGKELMVAIYSSLMISGNLYLLGIGDENSCWYKELYLLPSNRMTIIPGEYCVPSYYRYKIGNRIVDYPVNPINGYSDILHTKNYHPLCDWYGFSPLEVASFSIDQHNQASAWNQALLQSGARPSGAILVKNSRGEGCSLTCEQFERLKTTINESFSGAENAGKPLLLEGGLEWKEMSMSPKDMDYMECKNGASREIALSFGIPPQLLGIPGDNTYSNLAAANRAFWEQTVLPMKTKVLDAIMRWINKKFVTACESSSCDDYRESIDIGGGRKYSNEAFERFVLEPDLENINALSGTIDARSERLQKNNFMTINEKREKLGMLPIEGGDKLHA